MKNIYKYYVIKKIYYKNVNIIFALIKYNNNL